MSPLARATAPATVVRPPRRRAARHSSWPNTPSTPPAPPTLPAGTVVSPYQRAVMFVDNAGADVVLGMIPFARELLRMGAEVGSQGLGGEAEGAGPCALPLRRPCRVCRSRPSLAHCLPLPPQVVLVANSLPAINDITAAELRSVSLHGRGGAGRGGAAVRCLGTPTPGLHASCSSVPLQVVAKAAEVCPIIRAARDAAVAAEAANQGRIPPVPGHHHTHHSHMQRTPSPDRAGSSTHDELPAARSAAGFAFSPAPRRGYPVSGSSLLGSPLPAGSPLADQLLASAADAGRGGPATSSPLRRPPLPPGSQQSLQQLAQERLHPTGLPTSPPPEREASVGASEAVQRAIASLEAVALGQDVTEAALEQPAAAAGAAAAPAAAMHSRAASGELPPEELGPSSSGSGGDAGGDASWRQQRQLGGHRRRSPSGTRGRRQKGMFGESYPSPWRDPR